MTGLKLLGCGAAASSLALMFSLDASLGSGASYAYLDTSGNSTIEQIERSESQPWSVQVMADIQDGFLYLPDLLRDAESKGIDATIIAGDLARGGGGDHLSLVLDRLREVQPKVPVFAVPGNHDIVDATTREKFVSAFGSATFEFTLGATRFLGLDSTEFDDTESLKRVQAALDLAEERDEHLVVLRHHSPLPVPGVLNPHASEALTRLLTHPRVACVLVGHAHDWELERREGVRFLTMPSSGDRGSGQDQVVVSYIILRWDGAAYSFEHHFIPRRNWTEVATSIRHMLDAHLRPAVATSSSTWASHVTDRWQAVFAQNASSDTAVERNRP